jgi:hypothetical protein
MEKGKENMENFWKVSKLCIHCSINTGTEMAKPDFKMKETMILPSTWNASITICELT